MKPAKKVAQKGCKYACTLATAEHAVQAANESWAAYELHAFGYDELEPVRQKGKNNFGALGAMLIDSLDTLWLFGLRAEFDRQGCCLCLRRC